MLRSSIASDCSLILDDPTLVEPFASRKDASFRNRIDIYKRKDFQDGIAANSKRFAIRPGDFQNHEESFSDLAFRAFDFLSTSDDPLASQQASSNRTSDSLSPATSFLSRSSCDSSSCPSEAVSCGSDQEIPFDYDLFCRAVASKDDPLLSIRNSWPSSTKLALQKPQSLNRIQKLFTSWSSMSFDSDIDLGKRQSVGSFRSVK